MYVTNRATVEAYRKYETMQTYMQNPRPRTPTRIGGTTVPEHAKHEKIRVRREPRKYVTCHAAHAGRTTNKGGQRGVWSRVECK